MKRIALLIIIFLLAFACEKQNESGLMPQWLEEKVHEMESTTYYFGATLYRYQWNSGYYYEFTIPRSSCAYCDIYNADGVTLNWDDYSITDYLEQRTDKTFIWDYPVENNPID